MTQAPRRTDIDFEKFRKLLLAERNRLLQLDRRERAGMREEMADATVNEPADDDANAATLYDFEREQALEENERELLKQVNAALARIDDGAYGLSEVSGKPIPIERLRVIPWATMTVEEAERVI